MYGMRYVAALFLTSIFGPRIELFLSCCKLLVRDGLGTPLVPHFLCHPLSTVSLTCSAPQDSELASMLISKHCCLYSLRYPSSRCRGLVFRTDPFSFLLTNSLDVSSYQSYYINSTCSFVKRASGATNHAGNCVSFSPSFHYLSNPQLGHSGLFLYTSVPLARN